MKERKGARPVPGPTITIGVASEAGNLRWVRGERVRGGGEGMHGCGWRGRCCCRAGMGRRAGLVDRSMLCSTPPNHNRTHTHLKSGFL